MATARQDTLPTEWSYDELRATAGSIRDRINLFRTALGRFLVQKQELIDLMVVCAVAQEPLLLVGPPGTAKSDLVLKFTQALGLSGSEYFEYMLTRFTDPAEVLGPIDIGALRAGRYIRREEGKLPTARVAFLDEIFKSNSAVLNILLTIINERKFYQDGQPQPVALRILFGATNELPDGMELAALKDRFTLKAPCQTVHETHFRELIASGLQAEYHKQFNQTPWVEQHCNLDDLLKAHRYLTHQFADPAVTSRDDSTALFPDDVFRQFERMVKTLAFEDRIIFSDRKLVKLYKLMRIRAWLLQGGTVTSDDLNLLQFTGNTSREMAVLTQKIPVLLGAGDA